MRSLRALLRPSAPRGATLRWAIALLCAGPVLGSARARAQVAPPAVSELRVDPGDDRHLALRSNFGLMVSRDGGATWDWRCKGGTGTGSRGRAEPAVAILDGGTLVLGGSTGIVRGDPAGCDFRAASGIEASVVDVVALPQTPGAALAVSVSFADSSSRVWQSVDDGKSFRAVGKAIEHFTALSLGVPAASAKRVYMTGLLWGSKVEGALAVSDDGGRTFAVAPLAGSDSGSQPFLAGVHPARPDTIYVRMTGLPGTLRASDDGGRSFRQVLSMPGALQAFAISPRGDRLFASSLEAGTYRADSASLVFERIACGGVACLAATGGGLLGCGENERHGFLVGRSADEGRHFERLLAADRIAPARCGAGTTVAAACGDEWARIAAAVGRPDGGAQGEGGGTTQPFHGGCLEEGEGGAATAPGGNTPATTAAAPSQPIRRNGCTCEVREGGAGSPVRWMAIAGLLAATAGLRRRTGRAGAIPPPGGRRHAGTRE